MAATIATWASQTSHVLVRPQSSPIERAMASNDAITQYRSAFASCACDGVSRQT